MGVRAGGRVRKRRAMSLFVKKSVGPPVQRNWAPSRKPQEAKKHDRPSRGEALGGVPAVGAVRDVGRALELEHRTRVSRVRIVHQGVVAHHA